MDYINEITMLRLNFYRKLSIKQMLNGFVQILNN